MSSSSGKSNKKTKTGFSEADINTFLQRGANLASRRASDSSISKATPGLKTRTVTKEAQFSGTGSDRRFSGFKDVTTGFMDQFSDMSQGEVETLATRFKNRETSIQSRRRQPGRSALFMGRS